MPGAGPAEERLPYHLWKAGLLLPGMLWASLAVAMPIDVPVHQLSEMHWDVADGLPHSSGKTVLQTASGVVWIGTQNGLARFDGIEFEVFRRDAHPALPDDYIRALHEDSAGRIWIATNRGIAVYHGGAIHAVETDGVATGRAFGMVPGPRPGTVWLATNNGLFQGDVDRLVRHPRIHDPVFCLALADDGRLLVGGRGRIWRVDGNQVEEYPLDETEEELAVYTLHIHDAELLMGLSTGGGLRRAPLSRPLDWTDRVLEDHYILSVLVDDAGSLWVGTNSGLKRQRPGDPAPLPVRTRALGETDWVWHLADDREGNLWIGYQSGVIRLSASPFRRFGALDGLVDGPVWSYFEDVVERVWVGTDDQGAFRQSGGRFEQTLSPQMLPHATVNGFLHDRHDRLWVATMRGVAWFGWPDLEPLEVPPELPDVHVLGITEDADGRVWLAARPGLYWWREGELQQIDVGRDQSETLANDVLADRQGRIWVATDRGVFRGDAESMQAVGLDAGLAEYTASTLFEFDGTVWAALGGPMARFDGDRVRIYDGHGLGTSLGSFLAVDREQNLWSTTHEGIQRIHLSQFDEIDRGERERFDIEVFGRLTDPVIAQCSGGQGQVGLFQARQQALWCPTLNGALRLDLTRAIESPTPPLARLRAVRSGGEPYRLEFASQAALTLPASARDLEVEFSGLHFRHPEGVRYRFRLHGFDSDWQEAGRRRSAFYTNLAPGDYRFEVFAYTERGGESDIPAVVELHFTPRLHETTGFRLLMLVAMSLLLYGLWRLSVRQLRRRQMLLEAMVRDRTRQLDDANRQLRRASLTDPLTGLHNRRYLTEHLPPNIAQVDRAWSEKVRPDHNDIIFLMIDLDHFKRINDNHGHRVGDEVLRQFAELLVDQVRESDYVIRLGGEEFLVVARNTERDQAQAHARRIMQAVREYSFLIDDTRLACTCSVGISSYPALISQPRALSWEAVMELADAATYLAKEEGRDRWLTIELTERARMKDFMQRLRTNGIEVLANAGELRVTREQPAAS